VNEQIQQLAKQAGIRSPDLFKLTVSHMTTDTLEKFAQLIVRQCAEICLEANDHDNILRYFGVEK